MARKKTKKIGVAGKYGSRYGRKIRENVRKVESKAKAKHKCPQCGKESLKRISTGVWSCTKCKTKVAGGAYVPQTGLGKISRRAIQGASKEEIFAAIEAEEEKEEKPDKRTPTKVGVKSRKAPAKPKKAKPKKKAEEPKEEPVKEAE